MARTGTELDELGLDDRRRGSLGAELEVGALPDERHAQRRAVGREVQTVGTEPRKGAERRTGRVDLGDDGRCARW